MNNKRLHLCDFDGTLTRGDSFVRFLLFSVPMPQLLLGGFGLTFKFAGLLFSGKWSNAKGKAAVLSQFFKVKTLHEMTALGDRFCREKIPDLLRPDLLETLRNAHKMGEPVVIVSASPDIWLSPFCVAEGFDLLCTELEFEAGQFTGHFATPNCKGPEKARRIWAAYDLNLYEKIIAYGNSRGDAEMFELADEVFRF
ncbi:MAG: HAD-IB family phosphatase [Saprospiraceae bacterium]|nr:HAD-IB family phosphatase [Saprospiraceae bacterium]